MKNVFSVKIGIILFLVSSIAIAQQEYTNFDSDLEASALIIKYPENNSCIGSIEISIIGGFAPYTYSIDGGETFTESNISEDLCIQKYFIHVRDSEGKLGITFVNLSPPEPVSDPFTVEEKEAIRTRLVSDLQIEKSNYQEGSIQHRKVDWKLFKLGESINTSLSLASVTETSITYDISVLVPSSASSSQYDSELQRIKETFNDLNLDLVVDYGTWIVSATMNKTVDQASLNNLINYLGFETFSVVDNTSN